MTYNEYKSNPKHSTVIKALNKVKHFFPEYIPTQDKPTTFRFDNGRLKLIYMTDDCIFCGFILPHKKDPIQDNLIFLSVSELESLGKE